MLETLQNHPITQALKQTSKPCLFILMFTSIVAIFNHFYPTVLLSQLALFILENMIVIFSFLFTYYLCEDLGLSLISSAISFLNPSSTIIKCLVIPVIIYYIQVLYKKITKKINFSQLPGFVIDSITVIFLYLLVGSLLFIHIQIPFDFYIIIDSLPFLVLVVFSHCFCFYNGFHPTLISSIIGPIEVLCLTGNLLSYINGLPLSHYLTHGSMSAMCSLSGTGITIGIVLLSSKSFPKGTLLNSFFGVNEPVIFGLPIAQNKKAMIPFVVGGTMMGSLPFVLMKCGYLNLPIFDAPYLGLGLEGFLVNLDVRSFILAIIQIVLSLLFWYPYFKKELKHHEL